MAQMIFIVRGSISSGPEAIAELRDIMIEFAKVDLERIRSGHN